MNYLISKTEEWIKYFWLKMALAIPPCFFIVEEKERIMITALLVIIAIDLVLGIMKARYVDNNFAYKIASKKICKKFLLFFLTLLASFVLSKAYVFICWWFYFIGAVITFSEFGELMEKARKLGFPISSKYVKLLNNFVEKKLKRFIN